MCTQRNDQVRAKQKDGIYKTRSEASEETNLADSLVLDFQPPEM